MPAVFDMVWLHVGVSDQQFFGADLFVVLLARISEGLISELFALPLLVVFSGRPCSLNEPDHLFDSFPLGSLFLGCCTNFCVVVVWVVNPYFVKNNFYKVLT